MPSTDQTLLATAISEIARNITAYAVRGEVLLELVRDGNGRRGIQVVARDDGPGHRGPRARADRTATRPAAGSGSGCRARAGWSTSSTSRPRRGRARRCTLVKWTARAACAELAARALDRGERGRAAWTGEERSGDLAVFVPTRGGALVAA